MGVLDKLRGDGLEEYCEAHDDVDTAKCKKVLQPIINTKDVQDDNGETQEKPEVDSGNETQMTTNSKPDKPQPKQNPEVSGETPANDDIQLESVMADCVGDQSVLGFQRGGNEYACRLWAERQNRLISEQDKKLEELRNELNE